MPSKNLTRWFPRLKSPIEEIYQQWASIAAERLSNTLRSTVKIDLVSIDTLQSDGNAAASAGIAENPATFDCLAHFTDHSDPWTLRLDQAFVYLMIDRLLGATTAATNPTQIGSKVASMSSIDWRVAIYGLEELVHPCLDLWQPDTSAPCHRPVLGQGEESKPCDAVQVKFQVRTEATLDNRPQDAKWEGLWLIPESYIAKNLGRLLTGDHRQATLKVILAQSTISLEELGQLEVGDIISTEQLASNPAIVAWNSDALFRGIPGAYKGSKALRLIGMQESD